MQHWMNSRFGSAALLGAGVLFVTGCGDMDEPRRDSAGPSGEDIVTASEAFSHPYWRHRPPTAGMDCGRERTPYRAR